MQSSAKGASKQQHPLSLPHIHPTKSLPALRPAKDFDLRFVNVRMQPYNPSSDKFLSQFFERQSRIRALSSETSQKSLKTEPSALDKKNSEHNPRMQRKKKTLITENSKAETVKELSRQDFNNYLQTMKQRLAGRLQK